MRKTKIICTIGPASQNQETLRKMIEAGMNVARLNFSHGKHEEHRQRMLAVREAAQSCEKHIAIMLDTKGPEIRTGKLEKGKVRLESGQRFILTTREVTGNEHEVMISYAHLPAEVNKGTTILLSDGLINLEVEECSESDIICRVINGGELGERKGVNVPGVRIALPFLSNKDIEDINFGIDNDVDFIAASFVRTAQDVLDIRRILEHREADIDIIAKIESQEGVDNLEEIIRVADGIMVARGDLGVEIPVEEVPLVQKIIIEKCSQVGKAVIIATQMLESMINNPRPTRAEVSDVANAIFGGADTIMLSGESAAGKYPVEVVKTMSKIAARAEQALPFQEILRQKRPQLTPSVTDAISYATCTAAMNLGASAIITVTRTGFTANMVAKYRPQANIIAATHDTRIMRKLALVWGVHPLLIQEIEGTDELFEESINVALEGGYINYGDLVVLTTGIPAGKAGGTNMLKVETVGEILAQGMGIGNRAASGTVRIVMSAQDVNKIKPGDILVTGSADSSLAPYLDIVAGLVAIEGGLTSNAAIMGLNANIPVMVGVQKAIDVLKDDMIVTMDTPRGRIYRGLARVL